MTSDTVRKECAVRIRLNGKRVSIGGMAKGAGMINPLMATMLCFITTDARIDRRTFQKALATAVDQSFNCINVDGDMSTNDTVLALANGLAQNECLTGQHPEMDKFQAALNHVTRRLALMIVRDGEGVSRFVEVSVKGAASQRDARRAAAAVANSTLVKCSWCGGDPNWGRIMDALGYSGARVREEQVEIYYDGLCLVQNGVRNKVPHARIRKIVGKDSFAININLHIGQGEHTIYTTDLTEKYVRFNKGE